MKVLHIITRLDHGGSASNTILSVDLLRKHGFTTALAYGVTQDPDNSIAGTLKEKNITGFIINSLVRAPSPLKDFMALHEITKLLKAGNYDLVHTHTSKAGVLGRLAAGKCRVPAIHTPHGHIFYGYFGRILTALFVFMERMLARKTERIISLTDQETKDCLNKHIGMPGQYITIPSGVELSRFRDIHPDKGKSFRDEFGIPHNAFLFISIGRLVHIKGFDILLDAFSKADFKDKPAFLAIIGDGDERKPLELMMNRLGLTQYVRLTGNLQDIRPALSAGNAFILASRNEGMGRALIEAMAAGLPVIGTAVGGIPVVIDDSQTGTIIPSESPVALAHAMEELVKNPELRARMGTNAANAVHPKYDQDTMIEQLAGLYRDIDHSTKR